MEILSDASALVSQVERLRREGRRIGLVPTMGALHRGHTSLMRRLRADCDVLIVSIYVNPLQFLPSEDLARYPRDLARDAELCLGAGTDLVFTPTTLYPQGFDTHVSVGAVSRRWEGAARPGHFDGVATVCARLFGLARPHVAAFGEKDWQQLAVVRRMVEDLAIGVEIVGCPLVRDDDGVALSSRNAYLTPPERIRARSLVGALQAMRAAASTESDAARVRAVGVDALDVDALDYLAVVDERSLEPVSRIGSGTRAIVAARVGATRLIDNLALPEPT